MGIAAVHFLKIEVVFTCYRRIGYTEIIKLLLEKGADANVKVKDGSLPLTTAVLQGRTEIVKLLLEHKADANVKTSDGVTVLAFAKNNGYIEIAQLLENAGAKQ